MKNQDFCKERPQNVEADRAYSVPYPGTYCVNRVLQETLGEILFFKLITASFSPCVYIKLTTVYLFLRDTEYKSRH